VSSHVAPASAGRLALWVAIAATAFTLVLPLEADLPGRALRERVLLVAAVVMVGIALAKPAERGTARRLVTGALVALVFALVLVLRDVTPTGIVLLAIAIVSLLWYRRALAQP
jgi:hypothetical protein